MMERDGEETADDWERSQGTDEQQQQGRSPQIIFYFTSRTPLVHSGRLILSAIKQMVKTKSHKLKQGWRGGGQLAHLFIPMLQVC